MRISQGMQMLETTITGRGVNGSPSARFVARSLNRIAKSPTSHFKISINFNSIFILTTLSKSAKLKLCYSTLKIIYFRLWG